MGNNFFYRKYWDRKEELAVMIEAMEEQMTAVYGDHPHGSHGGNADQADHVDHAGHNWEGSGQKLIHLDETLRKFFFWLKNARYVKRNWVRC